VAAAVARLQWLLLWQVGSSGHPIPLAAFEIPFSVFPLLSFILLGLF
jgi:hypothetical protein